MISQTFKTWFQTLDNIEQTKLLLHLRVIERDIDTKHLGLESCANLYWNYKKEDRQAVAELLGLILVFGAQNVIDCILDETSN